MSKIGILYDNISGNTGDVAIGLSIKSIMQKLKVEFDELFPGNFNPSNYDTIIIGGGHLIRPSPDFYYDKFKVLGNHILNTVGILDSPQDLYYLNDYKYVTVRSSWDKERLSYLSKLVKVVPCTTMRLEDITNFSYSPKKPSLGIHLLPYIFKEDEERCFIEWVSSLPYTVYFLPITHYNHDYIYLSRLASKIKNSLLLPLLKPLDVFTLIGKFDYFISCSLHGGIFSFIHNIPFILFNYNEKMLYFMKDRGLEQFTFTCFNEMVYSFNDLLNNIPDYSRKIIKDLNILQEHVQYLKEILPLSNSFHFKLENTDEFTQTNHQIHHLHSLIISLKGEIQVLFNEAKAKDSQIADLNTSLQAKQEEITAIQNKIETLYKEAKEKDQLLVLKELEISAEKERKHNLEEEVFQLRNELTKKDTELVLIQNSLGWHIIQRYRKIADRIFPSATKRRLLYELPQKSLKILIFKGPINLLKKITVENIRKSRAYIKLYGFKPFLYKLKEKTNFNPILAEGKNINVPKIELINVEDVKIVPADDAIVSVIIPTKNAGSNFANLITVLKNQEGIKEIEIVIVDSGSTDETLEIAREYEVNIIEIQPESFTHSYSRNLGASKATGKYLLFTVQDALPPSKTWLYELLTVMKGSDVVAVSCAEIPREDADLFYKVICWNHYKFLEVDRSDRILSKPQTENYQTLRKNGQLSDIACLIPKDVFEKYKYRLNYAEDLDLGIRLIKDGYKLAFLSSIRIIHSHNRPAYYFLKRGYIDNLFLSNTFSDHPKPPLIVADNLFQDILFTYSFLNSIINNEFLNLNLPCRVEKLKDIVLRKIKTVSGFDYLNLTEVNSNQYADDEFKQFMQKINARNKTSQIEKEYKGILIHSMLNFIEMAFEYMGNTYDLIDDFLLEEVKSFIFKSFALICGSHLAHVYLTNQDDNEQKVIYNELKAGI